VIRTALVLLLLTVLVWPTFAQDLQPSIMMPSIRHDFGSVFEMDKYEYTFVVRNAGKADLLIEEVKPG
jgi:formate hydrogenlyase subunit 3/multisubunit Na+/H+ antiporter MnhD subunit